MKTLLKIGIVGALAVALAVMGASSALAAAELSVNKSSSVNFAAGGNVVTFTVFVENTGDATAEGVVIIDALNDRFTLVDQLGTELEADTTIFSNGAARLNWDLGNLAVGEDMVLTYRVVVPFLSSDTVFTNTVQAEADNVAEVNASDDITVRATSISEADLGLGFIPTTSGTTQLPSTGIHPAAIAGLLMLIVAGGLNGWKREQAGL